MADIAHIAGLVAAGIHPSPVPALRLRDLDDAQDPARAAQRDDPVPQGVREGPRPRRLPRHPGRAAHPHHRRQGGRVQRGAPAVLQDYQKQIVANASALAAAVSRGQASGIVSGGTDNHLFLVDVASKGLTGKVAEKARSRRGHHRQQERDPVRHARRLDRGRDPRSGRPAMTTRGMGVAEMKTIGELIVKVLARARGRAPFAAGPRGGRRAHGALPALRIAPRARAMSRGLPMDRDLGAGRPSRRPLGRRFRFARARRVPPSLRPASLGPREAVRTCAAALRTATMSSAPGGRLATAHPSYERRAGQEDGARRSSDALRAGGDAP
mgnify:CR=1 FL=1